MIIAMPPASLDDLMKVEGKAELIGGRIVQYMPTGFLPGRIARRITRSLEDWVASGGQGEVIEDNVGYGLTYPLLSGRESFSPDSSLYTGTLPQNLMRYVTGYPDFAVEVRSENDYGPAANREYADKRVDYFEAGTLVVWDVDPIAKLVKKYISNAPTSAVTFALGDIADAEPAVPGWKVDVASLFV